MFSRFICTQISDESVENERVEINNAKLILNDEISTYGEDI